MLESNTLRLVNVPIDEMANTIREIIATELQKVSSFITVVPKDDSEELMTRQEVSNLLKVSFTTLYWWDKENILQPQRLRRRLYYLRSEVMNKLNNIKNVA